MRHYQEETNDKLENLEGFVYETRITQQDHEDVEGVQQKEQSLISHELSKRLMQVEIQLGTMAFEQWVHNEVEENQKNKEGKGFGTSHGTYPDPKECFFDSYWVSLFVSSGFMSVGLFLE